MTLNNKIKQSGFTIVELLIVIVVIGILAAITIVAYNGIQNRAKTTTGQEAASTVATKAQAYNTIESQYPAAVSNFADVTESDLEGLAVSTTAIAGAPAGSDPMVGYVACTDNTGANITWWNFTDGSVETRTVGTC